MAYKKMIRNAHPSWAAKFIRRERLRQSITQEELSRRSGILVGNIRLIEWQVNSPRFETMEKLINTLGYDLHAIKPSEQAQQATLQAMESTQQAKQSTLTILTSLEKRANRNGMSLQRACEKAGVAYSTVTRWRSGFSGPTLKSVTRIDAVLRRVESPDKQRGECNEQIQWLEQLGAK